MDPTSALALTVSVFQLIGILTKSITDITALYDGFDENVDESTNGFRQELAAFHFQLNAIKNEFRPSSLTNLSLGKWAEDGSLMIMVMCHLRE